MALNTFINSIKTIADKHLSELENHFNADVLTYFGGIDDTYGEVFRNAIEGLVAEQEKTKHKKLVIVLQTFGGSVETTEKWVNMIRKYYDEVYFIIPNYAMSAGTIFCMSGNKIYMDYSSSLGPIDPQIYSAKSDRFVPALGYICAFDDMVKKSNAGTLSNAEFVMLEKQIDLAFLDNCKKLAGLTEKLLKDWLVKYKFGDWKLTATRKLPVTEQMKIDRAQQIAKELGDNDKWNIHSRPIMLKDLETMNLIIDDYTDDEELKPLIRQYVDFLNQYLQSQNMTNARFIHTRLFI